jgi:LytS/YehU family sensor histidine kinase
MIIEEIRNIKSGRSELKKFGFFVGIVFMLAGAYFFWKGRTAPAAGAFGAGIVFGLLGLFLPSVLKPLQKVWMSFAVVMGFIMAKLIMVIVFYGMVTPIGLSGRLLGKKYLDMKIDRGAASYWMERAAADADKSRYERQF